MWERPDNQEVGLEAAILQRKRNSSLVKRACAENVTGLKYHTEAAGSPSNWRIGRGAFRLPVKYDRQGRTEAPEVSMQTRVAIKRARNPLAVSPRFPG